MILTSRFLCENGVLYATITGEYTLEAAKQSINEMLAAVEQHRVGKVLLDGREVAGMMEAMERYRYGEYMARMLEDLAGESDFSVPRFAYVLRPPISDPGRFGETVAVNRGVLIRVFEQIEDARIWLEIGPGSARPEGK